MEWTATVRPAVTLLLVAGLLAAGVGVTGCASTAAATAPGSSTATATPGVIASAIEAALPLVRTAAAVASGAVLDFTVQQTSTRTRLANEMYSAASAIYSLSGGTFPTPAQVQSTVLSFGGSATDAAYARFASAVSSLYSAYYAKLAAGDAKTAVDLLNAIAGGIEDATASYVTPAPTTTGAS